MLIFHSSPLPVITRGLWLSVFVSLSHSCTHASEGESGLFVLFPVKTNHVQKTHEMYHCLISDAFWTLSSSPVWLAELQWCCTDCWNNTNTSIHTHTQTHAKEASRKARPFNHDRPSFRLEPYIWTYIFMLYFILSYMLGLCPRDIYVYLLAQVGFRLRDLFTKSSVGSSVLTPMYL